jgi:tellurite resistance protein TerC
MAPVHAGILPWTSFGVAVVAFLALDLFIGTRAHRRAKGPAPFPLRSAALWSASWIGLGLGFGLVVLALYGSRAMVTYFTAYVLEKSLSMDNLFVFAVIFGQLAIPLGYQRRVLHWGILGALAMRGLLIGGGVYLLERFQWILYPFALLILLAAARLLWGEQKERKVVVAACAVCGSWIARFIPVTPVITNGKFLVRLNGRLTATPLLIALLVIELSDGVFAMDSIPSVLAITRDPFLVYTSNVFAMLGLRSLYFLLAGTVERFHALRYALAGILTFVGAKMLLSGVIEIPSWLSLVIILAILAVTIAVSLGVSALARGKRCDGESLEPARGSGRR